LKQKYKIRDYIKAIYRDRIEVEIPFKSGDKGYLAHYQRAVTTILNKMTNDELEEARSTLVLWNKQGVPPSVQLK
jgi:hypothetical protein